MQKAIVIEPKVKADACVIWLHGLGADGNDFVDAVPLLSLPQNHTIRFIFPHAPKLPVSINAGMIMPAWYDIIALDLEGAQDEKGIRLSEQSIKKMITDVIEEGISPARIFLLGFSQGGALALHTALRYEKLLGGVASLSGYLPLHPFLAKEINVINKQLPIFMAHGFMDPVVSYWMGQKSLACLQGAGFQVDWHSYPIMHTISVPEMHDLGNWILHILNK